MIKNLSICVPTFNRFRYLKRFYNSLKNQDSKKLIDIELIIVDDGSTDKTSNLINLWKNENIFKISYAFQKNAGRSSALRKAITLSSMDYIMIMDDDCYFLNNFFSTISNLDINIDNEEKIAGFAFLRKNEDGKIIGNRFKYNYLKTDLISIRSKYQKTGDIAEITKTKIMKENLYHLFKNEKRMSTGVIWLNISKYYSYYFINEAIRVTPYLEDGISKNLRIHKIYSPNSTLYYLQALLDNNHIGFFVKINALINFSRYLFFNKKVDKSFHYDKLQLLNKILVFTFLPIGIILLLSDKYFVKKTKQKIR